MRMWLCKFSPLAFIASVQSPRFSLRLLDRSELSCTSSRKPHPLLMRLDPSRGVGQSARQTTDQQCAIRQELRRAHIHSCFSLRRGKPISDSPRWFATTHTCPTLDQDHPCGGSSRMYPKAVRGETWSTPDRP